jgi:hypothetical protein
MFLGRHMIVSRLNDIIEEEVLKPDFHCVRATYVSCVRRIRGTRVIRPSDTYTQESDTWIPT